MNTGRRKKIKERTLLNLNHEVLV